jgi:hypothetical protein
MRGKEDFDWKESFLRRNKLTKFLYPNIKL